MARLSFSTLVYVLVGLATIAGSAPARFSETQMREVERLRAGGVAEVGI